MMTIDLSDKLQAYAKRVESEVKRPLKIDNGSEPNDSTLKTYADANDKTYMHIVIASDLVGWEREQSIAHELSHWLLWARGYKNTKFTRPISTDNRERIGALSSMIDDIAVHKIQDAEGFGPFNQRFLHTIRTQIALIEKGQNLHVLISRSPQVASAYMAYSFVMAWSTTKFHKVDDETNTLLHDYMKSVGRKFAKEYNLAIAVKKSVEKNGVFTPKGHSPLCHNG